MSRLQAFATALNDLADKGNDSELEHALELCLGFADRIAVERPDDQESIGEPRQILLTTESTPLSKQAWLEVDRIASVEVTSEEQGCPIESALVGDDGQGWRAANPGTQIVRLVFDEPQRLRRIWITIEDAENTRTQEFLLRWSRGKGDSFREIVRQQ